MRSELLVALSLFGALVACGDDAPASAASTGGHDAPEAGSGGGAGTSGPPDDRRVVDACTLDEQPTNPACDGNPDGAVCIEVDNLGLTCGCVRPEQCRAPLYCHLERRRCEPGEVPPSCEVESLDCIGSPDGDACIEEDDNFYNRCGCTANEDCPGSTCDVSRRMCR